MISFAKLYRWERGGGGVNAQPKNQDEALNTTRMILRREREVGR
jgi:hypothetical protein